jgi:hypothetical protein
MRLQNCQQYYDSQKQLLGAAGAHGELKEILDKIVEMDCPEVVDIIQMIAGRMKELEEIGAAHREWLQDHGWRAN